VLAIRLKEHVLSVSKVEIVCQFHRDRVSILFGVHKPRSFIDFTEIVCRFRSEHSSRDRVSISSRSCVDFARWYIRVRWSSVQIWKIFTEVEFVGRDKIEEIEEDSTEMEDKGARNDACSRPEKTSIDRPVDRRMDWSTGQSIGVHDVHRRRPVDRPIDRCMEAVDRPVDWLKGAMFLLWPVDRRGGPRHGSVDRQTCFLLSFIDSYSFSGWDRINRDFLKPYDSVIINKG